MFCYRACNALQLLCSAIAAQIVHMIKGPNVYPTPTEYMDLAGGIISTYGLTTVSVSLVKKVLIDRVNSAYHGRSKAKPRVAPLLQTVTSRGLTNQLRLANSRRRLRSVEDTYTSWRRVYRLASWLHFSRL